MLAAREGAALGGWPRRAPKAGYAKRTFIGVYFPRLVRHICQPAAGDRFSLPVVALIVIVSIALTGCKSSRVATATALMHGQQETAGQAVTSASNRPVSHLVCPAFTASTVPSAPPLRGGHRVILSWKASDPEDANTLPPWVIASIAEQIGRALPQSCSTVFPSLATSARTTWWRTVRSTTTWSGQSATKELPASRQDRLARQFQKGQEPVRMFPQFQRHCAANQAV